MLGDPQLETIYHNWLCRVVDSLETHQRTASRRLAI